MKDKFIHICFVIDRSGSMSGTESDIIGGFKKVVDEQKAQEGFEVAVSLYQFDNEVRRDYRGKDAKEINGIEYNIGGSTALYDAVCQAIDETGEWLNEMDESQRPSQNLVVIMTDGFENSSRRFTASDVKERIKRQEEVYNWKFLYMGADMRDAKDATLNLGMTSGSTMFFSKNNLDTSFDCVNSIVTAYCCNVDSLGIQGASKCLEATLSDVAETATRAYEVEIGETILNR